MEVFEILSSGQLYYLREMIVALIMFSVLFVLAAVGVLIVFGLGHAGQGTLAWAGKKFGVEMRTPAEDPGKNRLKREAAPADSEFIEVKIATLRKTGSTQEQSVFDLDGEA